MKSLITTIFVLIGLMSCAPVQVAPTITVEKNILQSKTWNVAVLDLDYEFEEDGMTGITKYKSAGKDGGRVVAGILAAELGKLDNVKIIERSRVEKIIEEHALQQSGMVNSKSAIEIGKIAGADAVVIGELTDYVAWESIGAYGSTISFAMRLVDTKSSQVLVNASISRVHTGVEPFSAVQLTTKELVDNIKKN